VGQDSGTDVGRGHLPSRPVQECLVQLALELADLRADARLGDVHAGRRTQWCRVRDGKVKRVQVTFDP
jgi:hypothetical protein